MYFIIKFLDDKSYEGVIENIEKRDYEEAFKSAHSLKGVTANLGIEPIRAVAAQITDMLRNKPAEEVDVLQLDECKNKLQEAYDSFRKIVEENR